MGNCSSPASFEAARLQTGSGLQPTWQPVRRSSSTLERMASPESGIERTWHAVAPHGAGEGPVTFRVESPQQEATGEWGVLVSFDPIEPPRKIFGVDGRQALSLGKRFLASRAADLSERGWQFFWRKDGERTTADDLWNDGHAL